MFTGQRDAGALSLLASLVAPAAPSVSLSSGGITGTGYQWGVYWITGILDGTGAAHVQGRTPYGTLTGAQPLTAQQATVSIAGLGAAPTGAIGWGVARNKSGGATWYTVPNSEQFMSLAGTMPASFVDNVADASLTSTAPTTNTTGTTITGVGLVKLWDSTDAGVSFPAATITTPTLPQIYKHLIVVMSLVCDQASAQRAGYQINADAGPNYTYQLLEGQGASASAASSNLLAYALQAIAESTGGVPASAISFIPDYTKAQKRVVFSLGGYQSGGLASFKTVFYTNASAAAVTTLKFVLNGAGNYTTPSRFTIYGMP